MTLMSEQQTLKVYELAKELGVTPLSLVDTLKSLNINVKNHMSELGGEELQVARTTLKSPLGSIPAETKVVKKVAPRTKKKTTDLAVAATAAAPETSVEKRAASTVIRRRTKSDGGTETVTHQTMPAAAAPVTSEQHPIHQEEVIAAPTTDFHPTSETPPGAPVELETSAAQVVEEVKVIETPSSEQPELVAATPEEKMEAAPTAQEKPQQQVSSQSSAETTEAILQPKPTAPVEQVKEAAPVQQQPTPPVKKERPPIAPFVRPQAPPRKSILKIVEPTAPPPRPVIKPAPPITPKSAAIVKPAATTQEKDGYRIIKMTKENLDQMVEEEAAKKRGGGREVEIRPEDVRFADYRKKEMVFLPKKKKIPLGKEIKKTQMTTAKAQKRMVEMHDTITVQALANALSIKAVELIRKLMGMGQMVGINQSLDFETASLVASEYQYETKNIAFNEGAVLAQATTPEDKEDELQPRPPVVTIMGHVDHGKTTLLDSIREANVAADEAGGITQHIGAYTVEKNGKLITFIDTPGHEAFTVMRARGANVTDIVILVVSADDGVMPQTREALSHAQAAQVPIIVAVNKIDKPGANPDKVKQALAELNLLAEDWGGETMFVPVSALKKINIDKLLDSILLQSEMLDLKANPNTAASGTVLESRLEKGRGAVVSVLIERGTLKVSDPIVSGPYAGKVKALTDDKGHLVKSASPGIAVEILGFEGVPNAGEHFNVTASEADAREIAEHRQTKDRAKISGEKGKVSLDDLFAKIQAGDVKELKVILKADVFGSVEAIRESLKKTSTEKVKVEVIHSAAGGITESDVLLASASNAIIIGFNVRPETKARQVAEAEHVDIKCYNIIYELLDDVKKAMSGLLDKKKVEKFLGRAEVRQTFSVPKIGTIAGSAVIDGKIIRGANVRLLRDSRVIFEGKMSSLRRFKDDAKEVATGYECGIGIENYNDIKPGDIIEAYQIEMVTPQLSDL